MSKFEEAVMCAIKYHQGQKRKINNAPFIIHPMEVATIISTITTDEDVMIAGVLHDIVEDTGVNPKEIQEKFGKKVYDLVMSETENKKKELPAGSTWMERKESSLELLKNTNDLNVKILWLSDKLSNIRSLYTEYLKMGEDIWMCFHQHDKKMHGWYYKTILEYVSDLKNTPAYEEYELLVKRVFD